MNIVRIYPVLSFVFCFPVALLYHVFLNENALIDLFNIFLNTCSIITLLIGTILFITQKTNIILRPIFVIILLSLLITLSTTVGFYHYTSQLRIDADSLFGNNILGAINIAAAFCIVCNWDFNDRLHCWVARISLIVSALVVLTFTDAGVIVGSMPLPGDTGETSVAYQMYGRVVVFSGLLAIAATRNVPASVGLAALGIAALFQNGARTEFLLFLLAGVAMIGSALLRKQVTFFLTLGLMTASILLFVTYSSEIINALPESRVLELLRLQESSSWGARAMANEYALATVADSPIFGDYGSDFDRFGPGFYAHNMISAWVELGIVGIFLMLALTIYPIIFSLKNGFNGAGLASVRLCMGASIYSLLGYSLSYYYLTAYIGLSTGAVVLAWNHLNPPKIHTHSEPERHSYRQAYGR